MNDALRLGNDSSNQPTTLALKALTTHAFCLGMTGSGKTGLCVVLLEELLAQGVPVIAVDSKGDLATLLLSFDPQDTVSLSRWSGNAAQSKSAIEQAMQSLSLSGEQFAARRQGYHTKLYTPGSTAGISIDLIGNLSPPTPASPENIQAAAHTTVTALLGLLKVDADPVTSKEYLFLTQLLTLAWTGSQTPTLVSLIRQVNAPPFDAVGALPLEEFFPAKERSALMLRLNSLVASPQFAAWRQGEPLDCEAFFRAADGKPQLAIYSVAHLSDDERVAAVAQLLERVQSWMRKQGGANTTRAVLLVDEIFGYFPPSANPPTKAPLLSLLKTARAFGLSVVLATQNPVDLDYRGLANIGTWFVGRLQTEQDKARIRDALLAAAASAQSKPEQIDALLSTLAPRHFLLHSVHQPAPVVFKSRDALTLLHGPFSEDEIRELAAPMKNASPQTATASATSSPKAHVNDSAPVSVDPALGPLYEVDEGLARPFLLLKFGVRYRVGKELTPETIHELAFEVTDTASPLEALESPPYSVSGVRFESQPGTKITLAPLPSWVSTLKAPKIQNQVKERLPAKLETKLLLDAETKMISLPTEGKDAFIARVIAQKGGSKAAAQLTNKLEKKRADLAQAQSEVTSKKAQKWLTVGSSVLGLLTGTSRSLSGVGRAMSSHGRQATAEDKVEDLTLEISQLEATLAGLQEVDDARLSELTCLPKSGDVSVMRLTLVYIVP